MVNICRLSQMIECDYTQMRKQNWFPLRLMKNDTNGTK